MIAKAREEHARSGFTLVELLVVMALLSLLAAYAGLAMGQLAGFRGVESRIARDAEVDAAVRHLRQSIERLVPVLLGDEQVAEPRIAFIGEPSSLLLVTPGDRRLEPGGFHVVRYVVEEGNGERRLVARRWLYRKARPMDDASGLTVTVLGGVSELSLRYFGSPREGEAAIWANQWTRRDRLPKLVEVVLDLSGVEEHDGLPFHVAIALSQ